MRLCESYHQDIDSSLRRIFRTLEKRKNENVQHQHIIQSPLRLSLNIFPLGNKRPFLRALGIRECIAGNSESRRHANEIGSSVSY